MTNRFKSLADRQLFWKTLFEGKKLAAQLPVLATDHIDGVTYDDMPEFGKMHLKVESGSTLGDNFQSDTFLYECLRWMRQRSIIKEIPMKDHVAAISCGISKGVPVLDLDYAEDSVAETDANFVITGAGGLVEVQATAEGAIFSQEQLDAMIVLARKGVNELVALQKAAVAG